MNHKTPYSIQIAFTGLPRLKSRFIAVEHGLPRFKWFLYDAETKLENLKAIIESSLVFSSLPILKRQPNDPKEATLILFRTLKDWITRLTTRFHPGKNFLPRFNHGFYHFLPRETTFESILESKMAFFDWKVVENERRVLIGPKLVRKWAILAIFDHLKSTTKWWNHFLNFLIYQTDWHKW